MNFIILNIKIDIKRINVKYINNIYKYNYNNLYK